MTVLDGFLILLGATILLLCTMEGFLRTLMMLVSLYLVTMAAGMVTLATDALQGIAAGLTRATGGSGTPSTLIAQTIAFAGISVPLFIGSYFLTKMAFPETVIPKLKWLDNLLGLLLGIVLTLIVMALIYNTWGVAVSVRWGNVRLWQNMRLAFVGAGLRPYMRQVLLTYRPSLFIFSALQYPPFFIPQ